MLSKRGFTLIELLVVISIISLLSVFAFVDFKGLTQDQVTIKAIGEIQTMLRLAQSNATSSFLCRGEGGVDWKVIINSGSAELFCGIGSSAVQTTPLQGASIRSINGFGCTVSLPLVVTYSRLSGAVGITDTDADVDSCSGVSITVENQKNPALTKVFTISSGGAINVQ